MRDKDRYWDCLDQAMEASHSGKTEEALAWLAEALKAQPDGAEAHNSRGEVLWDSGRMEEALHEFDFAIQADAKFITAHLNRAELLIEEFGEQTKAIRYCDILLCGEPDLPKLDRILEAEILYLKSKAYFYLDNLEGALFLVRRALQAVGDVAVYRAFEGQILFEMSCFSQAKNCLEKALSLDPYSAHAFYHLGLACERLGLEEISQRSFEKADALDGKNYPQPLSFEEENFHQIARQAVDDLPRSIRDLIGEVPIVIEDFPSEEILQSEKISPQTPGILLSGEACSSRESMLDVEQILFFQRNLEKICRIPEDLAVHLQITIKHEIGLHLGLDEEDMERLGLL